MGRTLGRELYLVLQYTYMFVHVPRLVSFFALFCVPFRFASKFSIHFFSPSSISKNLFGLDSFLARFDANQIELKKIFSLPSKGKEFRSFWLQPKTNGAFYMASENMMSGIFLFKSAECLIMITFIMFFSADTT
jgi:hypothetical protein